MFKVRINKAPFILWSTRAADADVNLENLTLSTNQRNYSLTPVNKWQIFFLKYFPVLLLLYVGGVLPDTFSDLLRLGAGIAIAFLILYAFIKHVEHFKAFIFVFSAFVWGYMLSGGDAFSFERTLLYTIEAALLCWIFWEICSGRWEKYYFIDKYKSNITVTTKKSKTPLFKIGEREFLKVRTGFDYTGTFRLSGYYALIEEVKDED